MRPTFLITTLLAVAIALTACHDDAPDTAEGTFEATEITVASEISGRITSFTAEEGDSLASGQLVVQIDTTALWLQRQRLATTRTATLASRPDVVSQQATLQQQIANAQRERERAQRLLDAGAIPQKQLDDIDYQLATLDKQLKALTSSLDTQTDAIEKQALTADAQIAEIDEQLRRCRVTAPIGGTVLTKYKEQGEMAVAGEPLLKMADMSRVYLRAYLTSAQMARVKLGQKLKVTADYGGGQVRDYSGTVTAIASESEFTPKAIQTDDTRANLVYAVKIAVNNDGRLKIGFSGKVVIP